jgi:ACDE family multidrug resistance protein
MKKDSLLKLLALSGVPLIMVLGNSMLIPVFPDMERALDISKFQAGLTITLFSLPAR